MYVLFMPVFSPRTARQEKVNLVLLSTAILLFLSLTVVRVTFVSFQRT